MKTVKLRKKTTKKTRLTSHKFTKRKESAARREHTEAALVATIVNASF